MKYVGYFKMELEADSEKAAEMIARGYRLERELTELEFLEVEATEEEQEELNE